MKNLKTICERATQLLIQIEALKAAYRTLDQYEAVLSRHPDEIKKYGLAFVDTFEGKNSRWKSVCFKQNELVRVAPPAKFGGPFKTKKSKKGGSR